jgi:DNA replication and repair protein RecF
MILRKMSLRNFRNYAELELRLSESCNFFVGDNAQGKSNLLEAMHVLGLTRGFRASADRELIRLGGASYEIFGEFADELRVRHMTAIRYDAERGKEASLDRKHVTSAAWVGKFPMVLFSPECHKITGGPPSERRRFVDILLCQSSAAYLADLMEYNRVLRQRNALLTQSENGASGALTAWSQALAIFGCRITSARLQFVKEYEHILAQSYQHISGSSLPFALTYRTQFQAEEITPENFLQLLHHARGLEERRKRTQVGPHFDEFTFEIDGRDLRKYGSRGEQKSALVALKLAEALYLKAHTGTAPIILLDDLASELDGSRLHRARDYFHGNGQLMITSTTELSHGFEHPFQSYRIVDGAVHDLN